MTHRHHDGEIPGHLFFSPAFPTLVVVHLYTAFLHVTYYVLNSLLSTFYTWLSDSFMYKAVPIACNQSKSHTLFNASLLLVTMYTIFSSSPFLKKRFIEIWLIYKKLNILYHDEFGDKYSPWNLYQRAHSSTKKDQIVAPMVGGMVFSLEFTLLCCSLNLVMDGRHCLFFLLRCLERSLSPSSMEGKESYLSHSSWYWPWNPGRIN